MKNKTLSVEGIFQSYFNTDSYIGLFDSYCFTTFHKMWMVPSFY
ncbi:MAG TPA: hypothetical protein PKM97_13625 [Bacteroidia bacterium]|nr:hypothetical protein [Bacteroidia bacterium]